MHSVGENDNDIDACSRRFGSMKKLLLFNNIRMRILEQLRFLDIKTDSHADLVNELSDFFRHRGQLELERSRNLDKILHCFQISHNELMLKSNKQASYECWHHLIGETQSLSYDYATLSEMYNVNVLLELQKILRIYKKYQELVFETHEELLRILRNFFTTIKTYNLYQNEYKGPEPKSTETERKRTALRMEKLPGVRKYGQTERQNEICSSDKLETLKARNIYKHYTETSNANIHKCMLRDLSDIIYGMDTGFCLMVSRAMLAHVNPEQKQYYSKLHCFDDSSNAPQTKKSSMVRNQLFEDKNETDIQTNVHFEFELQLQLLKLKEDNLRKNLEKIYRILDMVEMSSTAGDSSTLVEEKQKTLPTKLPSSKHKDGGKLYILTNLSPIAKQISFKNYSAQKAKLEHRSKLTSALDAVHIPTQFISSHRTACAHKVSGRPKLFGGSLEEYLKITKESIPLIMQSCIRVIKLYGLHSQGIFRVSGSQVEILNFRDSFERGEDPLAGATDASDMNSVAGVLKLYLRELKEPLFPTKYFDIFISLTQIDSKYEVVAGMRNFFKNISKPVVIVIRFLFSFLNHLSEHANENMMDAFNLAVSFGPTLMPVPEDKKQLQYQTQLNELIKVIIVYHQEVFPKDLGGPQYDKGFADDTFEIDGINYTAEQVNEKPHSHDRQSTNIE